MTAERPDPDIRDLIARGLATHPLPEGPLVVGVSGGGDSVALMQGLARAVAPDRLRAVTVDHGFRAAARAEAALVARQAAELGIAHETVDWRWDGQGNLQAAAREGRWNVLADVARREGAAAVLLGHTADDQAETVLLRLARGSGVDGLAAMAPVSFRDGLAVHRPLLSVPREDLRTALRLLGCDWADDPSNDDPRFDRVRVRQALPALEALGLTRNRLLQTAEHMQAARLSLDDQAEALAARHVAITALGEVVLAAPLLDFSREVPRRLVAAALRFAGGSDWRPRFAALRQAVETVAAGGRASLSGCLLWPEPGGGLRVLREPADVAPPVEVSGVTALWDGRWEVSGPFQPGDTLGALGPAQGDLPDWRATGAGLPAVQASPAIRRGGSLLAAPAAGLPEGFAARLSRQFQPRSFPIEDRA